MKFIGFLSLLLALCSPVLHAEITDTVIVLKEVEARGVRFGKYTLGAKVFTIDSATLVSFSSSSVAELLSLYSLASVKSYGPEGVAGVSFRGGSSRHTAVIWNGFNLRSPSSGMTNFSTLSAGFFDEISVQCGGSSTMYGSGAATGAVFISDKLALLDRKIIGTLKLEMGSYETISTLASVGFTSPFFSTRFKMGYQQSANEFRFKNFEKFGKPIDTLEHAGYNRISLSQQNAIKIGNISKIETDFWFSKLDKEVPSLMSDYSEGTANQTDESIKGAVTYSGYGSNWSFLLRNGIFSDKVEFFDSTNMAEKSLNKSLSLVNEAEGKLNLGINHNFNLGINSIYESANSKLYISDTGRYRFSVYGRYNYSPILNRLIFSFEGRKEFIVTQKIPFVYSLSSLFEIVNGLSLKSIISKHYALPVFDDLFWGEDANAKGNPHLKPEYGFNFEGGIKFQSKNQYTNTEYEITFYQNNITDLIIWLPDSTTKYSPTNISQSKTNGIENSAAINWNWQNVGLNFNYLVGYTNALLFSNSDDKTGTQRFYTPKYKATLSAGIVFYGFSLRYSHAFYSKRYYDETNVLPWYTLGNAMASYKQNLKSLKLTAFFKINNVFNASYQLMNGYAQPMRNYSLGIQLTL